MRKAYILAVLVALAMAAVLPATAQEQMEPEEGLIGEVFRIVPKKGMTAEFEAGFKAHMDFHRAHNDPWTYEIYQVAAGHDRGTYIGGTFGHHWGDFDNIPVSGPDDVADAEVNLTPFREGADVWYTQFLPNLSNPPPTEEPAKMLVLYTIRLKMDKVGQYMKVVEKATQGIRKMGVPLYYYVEMLVVGGTHPTVFVVMPREKWADFEFEQKNPFDKILAEAFGAEAAAEISRQAGEAIAWEKSQVLVYKPELSLHPE